MGTVMRATGRAQNVAQQRRMARSCNFLEEPLLLVDLVLLRVLLEELLQLALKLVIGELEHGIFLEELEDLCLKWRNHLEELLFDTLRGTLEHQLVLLLQPLIQVQVGLTLLGARRLGRNACGHGCGFRSWGRRHWHRR